MGNMMPTVKIEQFLATLPAFTDVDALFAVASQNNYNSFVSTLKEKNQYLFNYPPIINITPTEYPNTTQTNSTADVASYDALKQELQEEANKDSFTMLQQKTAERAIMAWINASTTMGMGNLKELAKVTNTDSLRIVITAINANYGAAIQGNFPDAFCLAIAKKAQEKLSVLVASPVTTDYDTEVPNMIVRLVSAFDAVSGVSAEASEAFDDTIPVAVAADPDAAGENAARRILRGNADNIKDASLAAGLAAGAAATAHLPRATPEEIARARVVAGDAAGTAARAAIARYIADCPEPLNYLLPATFDAKNDNELKQALRKNLLAHTPDLPEGSADLIINHVYNNITDTLIQHKKVEVLQYKTPAVAASSPFDVVGIEQSLATIVDKKRQCDRAKLAANQALADYQETPRYKAARARQEQLDKIAGLNPLNARLGPLTSDERNAITVYETLKKMSDAADQAVNVLAQAQSNILRQQTLADKAIEDLNALTPTSTADRIKTLKEQEAVMRQARDLAHKIATNPEIDQAQHKLWDARMAIPGTVAAGAGAGAAPVVIAVPALKTPVPAATRAGWDIRLQGRTAVDAFNASENARVARETQANIDDMVIINRVSEALQPAQVVPPAVRTPLASKANHGYFVNSVFKTEKVVGINNFQEEATRTLATLGVVAPHGAPAVVMSRDTSVNYQVAGLADPKDILRTTAKIECSDATHACAYIEKHSDGSVVDRSTYTPPVAPQKKTEADFKVLADIALESAQQMLDGYTPDMGPIHLRAEGRHDAEKANRLCAALLFLKPDLEIKSHVAGCYPPESKLSSIDWMMRKTETDAVTTFIKDNLCGQHQPLYDQLKTQSNHFKSRLLEVKQTIKPEEREEGQSFNIGGPGRR
jgi:hypothetical protein